MARPMLCNVPRMIPLIVTGAISLASTALDAWHKASEAKTASQQQSQVKFEDLLKKAGLAAGTQSPGASQAILSKSEIDAMIGKLMQSPELQSALIGKGSAQEIGVRVTADGNVSVATAGGPAQNLALSPDTQALARQLRNALGALNQTGLVFQTGRATAGAVTGNMPRVVFQAV